MKSGSKAVSFQAVPTRFMLECAPLGKLSRAVHEFANKKALPTWLAFWAVLGLPIFAGLFFWLTGWPASGPTPSENAMGFINVTSAIIARYAVPGA